MGRPNRDRRMISMYVGETDLAAVDALAEKHGLTRSDVLRAALKTGLPVAAKELAQPK